MPKKYVNNEAKEVTQVKEFKLSGNRGDSIRKRKVEEMIRTEKEKEMAECRSKFKANPIPASTNHEKY